MIGAVDVQEGSSPAIICPGDSHRMILRRPSTEGCAGEPTERGRRTVGSRTRSVSRPITAPEGILASGRTDDASTLLHTERAPERKHAHTGPTSHSHRTL